MMSEMSTREPTIRPAAEGDAAAIVAIYVPYVRETAISFETEPPTAATMAQRIVRTLETHPWLVADCGGKTVGYAYAGKHRERAAYRWSAEVTVYVSGATRRCGIGRALYLPLLEILRRQGFRSALAEIVLPNPASIRLHETAGFKPIGVYNDVGFKLGRWHDIGYWRLGLADSNAPPVEPVPFATFRETPAFAAALRSTHDLTVKSSVRRQ
jgi:L-amino acid N-acyltransferase YncA